jgi:LuxR family maltose regulon positive regulatory protein
LVCGPPGSGKTALLTSVFTGTDVPGPIAWVSLESTEDDPLRLWDAVLGALRAAHALPAESVAAALGPPVRGSQRAFPPLLINALADLPEPVVLVLDDLHAVRAKDALGQLSFLLLHLPDTLRLVLSTRADPALPLEVLRVRGRCNEIRTSDLAFTEREAAALFDAHGVALEPTLVGALWARTEGWAAGLRLAALGLQGCDEPERFVAEFAHDNRAVGAYLLAEVLQRLPTERRLFLLRTSIAERLCGELADAITGARDGAAVLEELERGNGFVLGLDTCGCWYRYHSLFARILRTRLSRELGGEVRDVHARAARWYAQEGHGLGRPAARRRERGLGARGRARGGPLARVVRPRPGRFHVRAARQAAR